MDVRKVSRWILFGCGLKGSVGHYSIFFLFFFVCVCVCLMEGQERRALAEL